MTPAPGPGWPGVTSTWWPFLLGFAFGTVTTAGVCALGHWLGS